MQADGDSEPGTCGWPLRSDYGFEEADGYANTRAAGRKRAHKISCARTNSVSTPRSWCIRATSRNRSFSSYRGQNISAEPRNQIQKKSAGCAFVERMREVLIRRGSGPRSRAVAVAPNAADVRLELRKLGWHIPPTVGKPIAQFNRGKNAALVGEPAKKRRSKRSLGLVDNARFVLGSTFC